MFANKDLTWGSDGKINSMPTVREAWMLFSWRIHTILQYPTTILYWVFQSRKGLYRSSMKWHSFNVTLNPTVFFIFSTNFLHKWSFSLCPDAKLRFASSYGDHMVLQKSPAKAALWGYAQEGTQINISLSGSPRQDATVVADGEGWVGPLCKLICTVEGAHNPWKHWSLNTANTLVLVHYTIEQDHLKQTFLYISLFLSCESNRKQSFEHLLVFGRISVYQCTYWLRFCQYLQRT